jgi:hypothetical protein
MPSNYKVQRFASGKYQLYVDGYRAPVVIVGGNGRFNLEVRGQYVGTFKSTVAAAEHYMKGLASDGGS